LPITPKNTADDCIARAKQVLAAAGSAGGAADDLRRMALVMGVAALDTYMHAVVVTHLSDNRTSLPKALKRLPLKFEELAQLAENTVAAQQAGNQSRPWVQVKNALHRKLLTVTFQSYEDVGDAMAMAGVKKGWTKVAQQLGCNVEEIRSRLGSIVHRRNQIAHEGDLRRLVRPRNIQHNTIDHDNVSSDLDWLGQLIGAIDTVV
jgi:hypothetical protein